MSGDQIAFIQALLIRAGFLLAVIVIDVALGVTVAVKRHQFEWQRLADFLGHYAPQVIGWVALEALGMLPEDLRILAGIGSGAGVAAYGIILLAAVGSVMTSARELGITPQLPGVTPVSASAKPPVEHPQ